MELQRLIIIDFKGDNLDKEIKDRLELLKKSPIFSDLKDEDLEVISTYSKVYHFEKGEDIYKKVNGRLFIVKRGNIIIEREKDNKRLALAHYIDNETFGELDLFLQKEENLAAIAESESDILVFPDIDIDFHNLISQYPAIFANVLHKYMILIATRIRNNNKLISEKTPWIEELKNQLYRDKLTGLYNNIYLEEEFPRIIHEFGERIAFLYIKPDNFKDINDKFGHEAGDNALKFLADMIKMNLNKFIIARYRGNESCAILPEVKKEDAYSIAVKLKDNVKNTNIKKITGTDFFITLSIGIVMFPDEVKNPKDLINISYDKMMIARNSGGDRIEI